MPKDIKKPPPPLGSKISSNTVNNKYGKHQMHYTRIFFRRVLVNQEKKKKNINGLNFHSMNKSIRYSFKRVPISKKTNLKGFWSTKKKRKTKNINGLNFHSINKFIRHSFERVPVGKQTHIHTHCCRNQS